MAVFSRKQSTERIIKQTASSINTVPAFLVSDNWLNPEMAKSHTAMEWLIAYAAYSYVHTHTYK